MASHPLISVVTPCLNRATYVAAAVESVIAQHYPNLEHIVTDGGSTDGTLEVLRRYPHLHVVSEKDENLYDALNKAIGLARGEIIAHLNTDDLFAPGAFDSVARAFAAHPDADAVYGGATIFVDRPDGLPETVESFSRPEDVELSFRVLTSGAPIINARLFRRRVYERLGLYDLTFRTSADREFLYRVAAARITGVALPEVVYHYRRHAGSLTINDSVLTEHVALEIARMAERYLAPGVLSRPDARFVRQWHTENMLALVEQARSRGDWRGMLAHGARGWRQNARWPFAVGAALYRHVVRRGSAPEKGASQDSRMSR